MKKGLLAIITGGREKGTSKGPKENAKAQMSKYAQDLIDGIQGQDSEAVAAAFADLADCYSENPDWDAEEEEEDGSDESDESEIA